MKCCELMTTDPVCCAPADSVERASQLMKSRNVGVLPVISEGRELLGLVTDRDIVVRVNADARPVPDVPVEAVMSRNAVTCRGDDAVETALEAMTIRKVRRLPVVDENGRVIGLLSKMDVARRLPPKQVREIMARIAPSEAHRGPRMASPALVIGAAAAGAAVMYLLDPVRGRGRRAVLKDKAAHLCREMVEDTEGARNDIVNRALGLLAAARSRLQSRPVDDAVLVERVRSRLGRLVSHPHAVVVAADRGVVTLTGSIPRTEIRRLMHVAAHIPGVAQVVNHLEAAVQTV